MIEPALYKFLFDLILLLVTLAGGGLALWTWQKAYWEYQLLRQTEDWKARQSYSRKDARRQAMEGLLTELNEAVERHLVVTYHTVSAMVRKQQYAAQCGDDEAGQDRWQEMVDEQVTAFNESERNWLVQSAVLEGKLRLHFASVRPEVLELWPLIGGVVVQFCESLNRNMTNELLEMILKVRQGKDKLLQNLQHEIDRFTTTELELPQSPHAPSNPVKGRTPTPKS